MTTTYDDGTGTYEISTMSDAELVAMLGEGGPFSDELHRRYPYLAGLDYATKVAGDVAEAQWTADQAFDAMQLLTWINDPVVGATYRKLREEYRTAVRRIVSVPVSYTQEGRVLIDGDEVGTFDADGGEWRDGVAAVLASCGYRLVTEWRNDEDGTSQAFAARVQ